MLIPGYDGVPPIGLLWWDSVVDSAPLCGLIQLLRSAVMLRRNGRCWFQLNVTALVVD